MRALVLVFLVGAALAIPRVHRRLNRPRNLDFEENTPHSSDFETAQEEFDDPPLEEEVWSDLWFAPESEPLSLGQPDEQELGPYSAKQRELLFVKSSSLMRIPETDVLVSAFVNSNWQGGMKGLEELKLSQIFVIGSHDAQSYPLSYGRELEAVPFLELDLKMRVKAIASHFKTITYNLGLAQTNDVFHQLKSGSRYLDFRIFWHKKKEWRTHHGLLNERLDVLIQQVLDFQNEALEIDKEKRKSKGEKEAKGSFTEIVQVRLKYEGPSKSKLEGSAFVEFKSIIRSVQNLALENDVVYFDTPLKEMTRRGKPIIIVVDGIDETLFSNVGSDWRSVETYLHNERSGKIGKASLTCCDWEKTLKEQLKDILPTVFLNKIYDWSNGGDGKQAITYHTITVGAKSIFQNLDGSLYELTKSALDVDAFTSYQNIFRQNIFLNLVNVLMVDHVGQFDLMTFVKEVNEERVNRHQLNTQRDDHDDDDDDDDYGIHYSPLIDKALVEEVKECVKEAIEKDPQVAWRTSKNTCKEFRKRMNGV